MTKSAKRARAVFAAVAAVLVSCVVVAAGFEIGRLADVSQPLNAKPPELVRGEVVENDLEAKLLTVETCDGDSLVLSSAADGASSQAYSVQVGDAVEIQYFPGGKEGVDGSIYDLTLQCW